MIEETKLDDKGGVIYLKRELDDTITEHTFAYEPDGTKVLLTFYEECKPMDEEEYYN